MHESLAPTTQNATQKFDACSYSSYTIVYDHQENLYTDAIDAHSSKHSPKNACTQVASPEHPELTESKEEARELLMHGHVRPQ